MAKKKKDDPEKSGEALRIDREGHVSQVGSGNRGAVSRKTEAPKSATDTSLSTGKQLAVMRRAQAKSKRVVVIGLLAGAVVLGAVVAWLATRPPPAPAVVVSEDDDEAEAWDGGKKRDPSTRKLANQLTGAKPTGGGSVRPKAALTLSTAGPPPNIGRKTRTDPVELARTLQSEKAGAVQLCYEKELKKNPRLKGKVSVTLDLVPPGKVLSVSVNDSLGKKTFTECVRNTMKRAAPPPVYEPVTIELPFNLKAPDF